jgi:hypothetical protein
VTAEVIHGNSAGADRAGPGDNKLIDQAKRALFPKWRK